MKEPKTAENDSKNVQIFNSLDNYWKYDSCEKYCFIIYTYKIVNSTKIKTKHLNHPPCWLDAAHKLLPSMSADGMVSVILGGLYHTDQFGFI